jgi:hypothetical protein
VQKNIYVLTGKGGIDKAEGFVVVAEDAQEARQLAASQPGDEGGDYWHRPDVTVTHIGRAFEHIAGPDIILRAFHAG